TFERIATGLAMPDHARITLGLAPVPAVTDPVAEPPAQPVTAGQIHAARLDLGRQLAAWRDAAQVTQLELAQRVYYSRSTVAVVETGRQNVGRQFWQRADTHLGADGLLLKAFEQVDA